MVTKSKTKSNRRLQRAAAMQSYADVTRAQEDEFSDYSHEEQPQHFRPTEEEVALREAGAPQWAISQANHPSSSRGRQGDHDQQSVSARWTHPSPDHPMSGPGGEEMEEFQPVKRGRPSKKAKETQKQSESDWTFPNTHGVTTRSQHKNSQKLHAKPPKVPVKTVQQTLASEAGYQASGDQQGKSPSLL